MLASLLSAIDPSESSSTSTILGGVPGVSTTLLLLAPVRTLDSALAPS